MSTSFGIPDVQTRYNYVIVGSGLAGSIVAARLAENTPTIIAVIEGGSFY